MTAAIDTGLHYPIDLSSLPKAWLCDYVGVFAESVQSGFACGAHNSNADGVPHVRPMNISRGGRIELSDLRFVPPAYDDRRLAQGDVLFNNTNSPELIGKTAYVGRDGDGLAFSNHMTRLRFFPILDPRFAATQLHYLWSMKYFLHRCVNHVNQASVSSTDLGKSVPLVVPPLNEQRRIVAKIEELFSELDKGVESLTTAREQLNAYRQSVLKQAFDGKLSADWRKERRRSKARGAAVPHAEAREVIPEEELKDMPSLPAEWRYARLGEFIERIDAGKSFRCDERVPEPNEVGVAKVSAVTWGEYDEDESKTCKDPEMVNVAYFIKEGDFLFSRANTIELVGACVIVKKVRRKVMLSDKTLRVAFTSIPPRYVLHYLRSHFGRREIMRRSTGNQESMRNIGQDRIRSMVVPVCPHDEAEYLLERIQEIFGSVDQVDGDIEAQLSRAEALRQSILKRAFSGQLVAQDPQDEPASVLLERVRAKFEDGSAKRRRDSKAGEKDAA